MSEIQLKRRYPDSRPEDISDAYMRGFEYGFGMDQKAVDDLQAENDKLRELVRDLYMALWTCNQHTCKHGNDGCYTEDGNSGGRCTLHDRMYELGVRA